MGVHRVGLEKITWSEVKFLIADGRDIDACAPKTCTQFAYIEKWVGIKTALKLLRETHEHVYITICI